MDDKKDATIEHQKILNLITPYLNTPAKAELEGVLKDMGLAQLYGCSVEQLLAVRKEFEAIIDKYRSHTAPTPEPEPAPKLTPLPEHVKRMYAEYDELTDRFHRLRNFFVSEQFHSLDALDQDLLVMQSSAMQTYRDILRKRITTWEAGRPPAPVALDAEYARIAAEFRANYRNAKPGHEGIEVPSDYVYVGTKALKASPMPRGNYIALRGWTMPADENPDDPGYIVQYVDGYVSWSPAETFEATYRPFK